MSVREARKCRAAAQSKNDFRSLEVFFPKTLPETTIEQLGQASSTLTVAKPNLTVKTSALRSQ
jgi:hypothetical protein